MKTGSPRYASKFVLDIFEQKKILATEHNRAYRAAQENVKRILLDYYFPEMTKLTTRIVAHWKICSQAKYKRLPEKHFISENTISSYASEILHIDFYFADKKFFPSCVDKFSKFVVVQPIQSIKNNNRCEKTYHYNIVI